MTESQPVIVSIIENRLTNDEIRVLSLLRETISARFGALTIQVHEGQVISAEISRKMRF